MIIFICSSIYSVYSLVTVTVLCDGGINCRWQTQGKNVIIFICSSIYSVYSLVTVTILCDGEINCRWQLKVKCDYFYLFLYLFSLFFSDCYHIVWWRNQLSMATQGKMWLFLFVPLFIQFILQWLSPYCVMEESTDSGKSR